MDGLKLPGAFFFSLLCISHTFLLGGQVNGSRLGPTDKWFNPSFWAHCCLWLVAVPADQSPLHRLPGLICIPLQVLIEHLKDLSCKILVAGGEVGVRPFVGACSSCLCAVVLCSTFERVSETVCLEITENIILSLSQDRITPTRGHYHISTLHHFFIHTSTHSSVLSLFYFHRLSFCTTFLPSFFSAPAPALLVSSHTLLISRDVQESRALVPRNWMRLRGTILPFWREAAVVGGSLRWGGWRQTIGLGASPSRTHSHLQPRH